jgi:hypothetical protein
VRVDGDVPSRPCQIFALFVGNVLAVPLEETLGQPKIDEVEFARGSFEPNAEVFRLDVAVQELPAVNILNAGNHLVEKHEDCLEGEPAAYILEEGLEGRTQKVHHQYVVAPCL